MSKVDYKPNYQSEVQIHGKALEIIKTLEGIPIGNALHVLNETKAYLLDSHLVDTSNEHFKYQSSEHLKFLISAVESDAELHK